MLGPTKTGTLHPETKQEPHEAAGGLQLTWNLLPHPSGGQPMNWEVITPQRFFHRRGSHTPLPRGLATRGGAPRASGFQGKQELIAGTPQDGGKLKLHSWRVHTRNEGKSSGLAETWTRLPACTGGWGPHYAQQLLHRKGHHKEKEKPWMGENICK